MRVEIAKFDRDYETIVNFQVDMAFESEGLELEKNIVSQGVKAVFDDPQKGIYYVALKDSKVIGSLLTMNEWSDWRNANVMWIHSVFISPAYRRQGVYSEMYKYLKKYVDDSSNYCGIRLYVDKENLKAINTYKKLGMIDHHYDLFEYLQD